MYQSNTNTLRKYRSLFWPAALIGVGLVLLLGNLGIIGPVSIYTVLQLWPLLLIAIGLDIIFGHRRPLIGLFIGLSTLVVALAILIAAPSLGLTANTTIKTSHFSEPVGNAVSASVELHLSDGATTVSSLADSNALISADVSTIGQIDFVVMGDANKTVRLQRRSAPGLLLWPFGVGSEQTRWDIGLNPKLPLDLTIAASSGDTTLNANGLNLHTLTVNASSGNLKASLPAEAEVYQVRLEASSGNLSFDVPDGAALNASMRMSSGNITFNVPGGAGVQLNVQDSSSGSVRVPPNYTRTVDNGRNRGAWESPGFGKADSKIILTIDNMSSGSFTIR
jgi:Domain of unknown function (DUF5668)/Putative adhesin